MSELVAKMKECVANLNEVGCEKVEVESLMDIKGWIFPEKADAIFEEVVAHVKKLPAPFFDKGDSAGGGWTFGNLVFFDNGNGGLGEQWGTHEEAGLLILLCAYYGIVQDPLHTLGFTKESIMNVKGGVSYFSFNIQEDFLNLVRRTLVQQ